MMLLRANVLALGFSGIRLEVIELLCEMLNRGVHPVIPEKGSVGASGDLAPLAHLALALIGEGEAFYRRRAHAERRCAAARRLAAGASGSERRSRAAEWHAGDACRRRACALLRAKRLARVADVIGAMTLEALKGTPTAFDERIQNARPHPGQKAAAHISALLREQRNPRVAQDDDPRVQDAYSLRCMPQVHGAVRGALAHCEEVLAIESGSATDNPLVFAENGDVLSGGNFHGAPLALALDYAAIAMTDLMSISERRIDRLVNPDMNEGLPAVSRARTPASHPAS